MTPRGRPPSRREDRKSTRLNSSHGYISYAVFCLKKKNTNHLLLNGAVVVTKVECGETEALGALVRAQGQRNGGIDESAQNRSPVTTSSDYTCLQLAL